MTTRLLAIETATAATAIAALDEGTAREVLVDSERRHTEVLAPAIAELLSELGWTLGELDAVVVDIGPGLFTGLRVGVATAKGFNVATGVGLATVTSTEALAAAAGEAGITGTVACVVDARRREVFAAAYACGAGEMTELLAVSLWDPAALGERLAQLGPVTLVGDGAVRHRDALAVGGAAVRDDLVVPSPLAAARLARTRAANGAVLAGHAGVHPWYLREPDAVANFAVRDSRL